MGRMERIKKQLAGEVLKISAMIASSQKNGKIPSDYSLGFANAMVHFEHALNMRPDSPKYFDRVTSIGTLPVPVALRSNAEISDEFGSILKTARAAEVRNCEEDLITQARGVIAALDAIEEYETEHDGEDPEAHLVKSFTTNLAAVKKAIAALDNTVSRHMEADHMAREALKEKQNALRRTEIEKAEEVEQASLSAPPGAGANEEGRRSSEISPSV